MNRSLSEVLKLTNEAVVLVQYGKLSYANDAARVLLGRLGLTPENMLAAGDNINDVSMLELAAVSVAPANAIPEVLAAASVHVADSKEDGVENFLKQLL